MGIRNRESDIVRGCLDWLQMHGVFVFRNNQGAIPTKDGRYRKFTGMRGASDLLGIIPQTVTVEGDPMPSTFGNFLAVEVKRDDGRLSADQVAFLATVNRLGGIGVCVRSVAELEKVLKPYLPS
jgi:hypothetical protein